MKHFTQTAAYNPSPIEPSPALPMGKQTWKMFFQNVKGQLAPAVVTDEINPKRATFEYTPVDARRSQHALRGVKGDRWDVWFTIPGDSRVWHGVKVGEMHTRVHCRPTKRMVAE